MNACHARATYVPRSTQACAAVAIVREHWPAFRLCNGRAAETCRAMRTDLVAVGRRLPIAMRDTPEQVVACVLAMEPEDQRALLRVCEARTNDRPAVVRRRRWVWRAMLRALDALEDGDPSFSPSPIVG